MEFGAVVTMASSNDGVEVARWSSTAVTMNANSEKGRGLVATQSEEVVVLWCGSDVDEGARCRIGGCGVEEGELASIEVGMTRHGSGEEEEVDAAQL
jgi:hypothetical protein